MSLSEERTTEDAVSHGGMWIDGEVWCVNWSPHAAQSYGKDLSFHSYRGGTTGVDPGLRTTEVSG